MYFEKKGNRCSYRISWDNWCWLLSEECGQTRWWERSALHSFLGCVSVDFYSQSLLPARKKLCAKCEDEEMDDQRPPLRGRPRQVSRPSWALQSTGLNSCWFHISQKYQDFCHPIHPHPGIFKLAWGWSSGSAQKDPALAFVDLGIFSEIKKKNTQLYILPNQETWYLLFNFQGSKVKNHIPVSTNWSKCD